MNFLLAENEIKDSDLTTKLAAQVKEIEIQQQLNESKEFSTCKAKYKPDTPNTLGDAEKCISDELKKISDPKKLEALGENLNLFNLGLIPSKDAQSVQKYLSKKMYVSLTGVDPDEENVKKYLEALKFNKKKHIDPKEFYELYRTQLIKNSLFEISKYCLEDLRNGSGCPSSGTSSGSNNFASHWNLTANPRIKLGTINDCGEPKFDNFSGLDKKNIYESIHKNLGVENLNSNTSDFFSDCMKAMKQLCENYKPTPGNSPTVGSKSCLVKERIRNITRSISAVDKLIKDFNQNGSSTMKLTLDYKIFDPSNEDTSYDRLTSYSSGDIIGQDAVVKSEVEDCEKNPQKKGCSDLLIDGKDYQNLENKLRLNLELQKQIAVKKVELIKNDTTKLNEYLEQNGYFDLAAKLKKDPINTDIEAEVQKIFDAKKSAILAEYAKKVMPRQKTSNSNIDQEVKKVAIESKAERSRLAQVVMFNNIITSVLDLKNTQGQSIGKNVSGWQAEERNIAQDKAYINEAYFNGIKSTIGPTKGSVKQSFQGADVVLENLFDKEKKNN